MGEVWGYQVAGAGACGVIRRIAVRKPLKSLAWGLVWRLHLGFSWLLRMVVLWV